MAVIASKSWGNTESNRGIVIDTHDDGPPDMRYEVQFWSEGVMADQWFLPTWDQAMAQVKGMLAYDYLELHAVGDVSDDLLARRIVGLAPGRSTPDQDWHWSPVTQGDADIWWEGSDYEDPSSRDVAIDLFPTAEPA